MKYQLSSIEDHLDFGFGITSESYYNAAEFIESGKEQVPAFQLVDMPINFLYRHSIELSLKSLIIIFHKRLKLPYGEESFESKKPKILSQGKWRPLYNCHWIDELYRYWKDDLLIKNIEKIKLLSNGKGDWQESKSITDAIPIISKYDRNSSFFRYPVTEDENMDLEKFTMQKMEIEELVNLLENKESKLEETKPKTILAYKNDQNEITKAYVNQEVVHSQLTESLKKVAYYFYCQHIMTRIELCNGE